MAITSKGMANTVMTLIHADTGVPVEAGEEVLVYGSGNSWDTITGGNAPHKPSSTGFVHTADGGEYYPGVYGLKWVEEV